MVREIISDWTTAAGGGFVTVMFFDDVGVAATQRFALGTFWQDVCQVLHTSASVQIRTTGREFDTATGALTGQWTETTPHLSGGDVSGQPVADSTQILCRWQTGQVVSGRFLQGRTFIPGLEVAGLTNGNLSAAAETTLNDATSDFVAADGGSAVFGAPACRDGDGTRG